MLDDTAVWEEWKGQVVPRSFSPGYVVLSYFVSYVGALTTLELINRRTSVKGAYNWNLLFGSSISMGGISIWCMHYLSNRAIILGDGQLAMQIAYSPGFTAMSFFVPILVLLTAFTAVGSSDKVSIIRVAIGGTLAGLAICGMHFIGQAGISNYTSIYSVGYVVGSALVAVAASIAALSLFFVLRATWANFWWKRALCSIILSAAVFGMHWVASIGTQYRLVKVDPTGDHNNLREAIVIVVIVLSISACFVLVVLAVLAQRGRSRSANRAQQVALACVIFDNHGKLMVTPEGLLPNKTITTSYIEQSFDEVFGISHPVFHWIFRTTRNWSSISSLLPGMHSHLYHASKVEGSRFGSKHQVSPSNNYSESTDDYSTIFRELFCITAADLAQDLNLPLENVGILFDEIFSTGQKDSSKSKGQQSAIDLESDRMAPTMPGRGQLLVLVRRANGKEADQLSASGYRFAAIENVAHIIGNSMQINCNDLPDRLSRMYEYSSATHILEPGVHMACFAIRASVRGGFDVLVRKDARNQLPTMQLPIDKLNSWNIDYLSQLDGASVTSCLRLLSAKLKSSTTSEKTSEKEQDFATQLCDTLEKLKEEINDPSFANAILVGRPVPASCRGVDGDRKPGQAMLIAFHIILPIQFRVQGQKFEFIPLKFFKTQQLVYRNSPHHALFARKIHREFGQLLNKERLSEGNEKSSGSAWFPRWLLWGSKSKYAPDMRSPSDVSILETVETGQTDTSSQRFWRWKPDREPTAPRRVSLDRTSERKLVEPQAFGGIMVSQEVDVDVRDFEHINSGEGSDGELGWIEMREVQHAQIQIGTRSGAAKEEDDPETYVDRLFAACIKTR